MPASKCRTRSLNSFEPLGDGAQGWPLSVRAPSCSRQPVCWQASAPPHTGAIPKPFLSYHPEITVDANVLYVEEDRIFTSAGSAAGIDLMIHIVRQDFGVVAANSVARRLVMSPYRAGGQAQFIERPVQTQNWGCLHVCSTRSVTIPCIPGASTRWRVRQR